MSTAPLSPDNAPAAAKRTGLVPVLLGINSVAILAVLGFIVLKPAAPAAAASPRPASEASAEPAEHAGRAAEPTPGVEGHGGRPEAVKRGPSFPLGEFIARVKDADGDRYVRFQFEALLNTDSDVDKLKQRLPEIRDRFILTLSDLSLDQVRGKTELEATKQELLQELRDVMPGTAVRALYMTEFVVQ